MAKKKRLISGEKFYCRCPSCSETWDYPPVISYLDDENTLPITDRHTTCTATDPTQDMAYNFSIALSCRDEKTQEQYWQVIRGCSSQSFCATAAVKHGACAGIPVPSLLHSRREPTPE